MLPIRQRLFLGVPPSAKETSRGIGDVVPTQACQLELQLLKNPSKHRAAERGKAKLARGAAKAEQKRREAEAAAQAAAQLAREKEEAAVRELALEAERKAARDARYAARKKRK